MAYLETMTALDIEQRRYQVIVNGVSHGDIAGSRIVKDYMLKDTGEMLEVCQEAPLVLRIRSSDTHLVDSRDVT